MSMTLCLLRSRRLWVGLSIVLVATVALGVVDMLPAGLLPDRLRARSADDPRVPMAVLGDSDSHGYQDTHWFPPTSSERGGAYRDITLQWTEVLARLRPAEVDLGDVGLWGGRERIVTVIEALGGDRRLPRKRDHQYNFAFSGAHCSDLLRGKRRQVPRLLALMDREAERWQRGVVVLRIGIRDLGGEARLTEMARDPDAAELVALTRSCTDDIAQAVANVLERHPRVRVVLVGIVDSGDGPPLSERARPPAELARIAKALDRFDESLRRLARADARIAFFDDRAWCREQWGSHGPDGAPAFRTVRVGESLEVVHAMGDKPTFSTLADGHAGLVWNSLWCKSLVDLLTAQHALPIRPIPPAEVERFILTQCAGWL